MSSPGVAISWDKETRSCFIRLPVLSQMVDDLIAAKDNVWRVSREYGWTLSGEAMKWSLLRCAGFYEEGWPYSFAYIDGIPVSNFVSFEEGLKRLLSPGPHELGKVFDTRWSDREGTGVFIVVLE
jgi:hypothetical protein